ncbi:hypothetical protein TNCV_1575491 [Trichonephila clavipes]|nr:hypothetical protein TNCV_1575491 [Trichonephila clavipes]
MFLRVWFYLLTNPFHSGWYGVEKNADKPQNLQKTLALNWHCKICCIVHYDLFWNSCSTEYFEQRFTRTLVVSDLSGIASGHLECWSNKQSMYLCPCDTGSTGPIKSTFTTWNGNSGRDTGALSEYCQRNELLF